MKTIPEQQFYDLLSLKLSGNATAEQLALLQQQLLLNPQWQLLYDQMMQNPATSFNPEERARQAYAAHFTKMQLQGKFDEQGKPDSEQTSSGGPLSSRSYLRKVFFPLLAAASLAGLLVCMRYLVVNQTAADQPASRSEVLTRKGSKTTIKLPDGTMVWLNADSKLIYSQQFSGKIREVSLSGEAYFDVAHDTIRPFIIHTGNARIKVLGTAFNVRNYPHDKTWETTLMRGKIEVSLDDRPDERIILKPLEKLTIAKNDRSPHDAAIPGIQPGQQNSKVTLSAVNYFRSDSVVAETSWINDKLIFVNEPLEKIAEELERQFAVTVVFKTPAVRNYRYTGDFEKESLEKILKILSMSRKIDYSITDTTIYIR